MSCRTEHGRHSSCVSLTSARRKRPLESWGFPLTRLRLDCFMGEGNCARDYKYTAPRPRTLPNPPRASSFGFERAIPSLWPGVTTTPGRDSWRGGIRVCWIETNSITRGLAYEIERQERCDVRKRRKSYSIGRRGCVCKPRTKSRGNQAPGI